MALRRALCHKVRKVSKKLMLIDKLKVLVNEEENLPVTEVVQVIMMITSEYF